MNIFIAIMLVFAAAGLLDEILGGKLGLMPNFEKGLATMGGLAMSTVGFYAIGVTYVRKRLRRRQSICHLIRRSFQAAFWRRIWGRLAWHRSWRRHRRWRHLPVRW